MISQVFLLLVLGRFDDLESLAYTLMFLSTGNLPWYCMCHVDGHGKLAFNMQIIECKNDYIRQLSGSPLEKTLTRFLGCVSKKGLEEIPHYEELRELFETGMVHVL